MIGGRSLEGTGASGGGSIVREVAEPQSVRPDDLPPATRDLAQDLRLAIVWASAALAAIEDEHEGDLRRCVDRLADYAGHVRATVANM